MLIPKSPTWKSVQLLEGSDYAEEVYKANIPYRPGIYLIYSETRSLQRLKTKKRDNLSTLSLFVPLTLPPSNSFYENVEERYALKETFVQQGILSGEGHGLALARPQVMLGNKICWCSKITSKEWFRCF